MTERIKLNEDERYGYFVRTRHRKKLLVVIVSLVLIMSLLTVRVGYIMTVRADITACVQQSFTRGREP